MIILVALGIVLLVVGVPVAFILGLVAIVAFQATNTSLIVVPQQGFQGIFNFILLALPFFILTGAVMESGGVSRRLTNFAGVLVGWMRGGLGMVDVVASVFFADISGSATADTAAIGSVMIPALIRRGYHPAFATALQSAAGSLGLLFPPSITMIVYAYVANVSVGKLFLAGFIPGLLVAASFMVVNYVTARRRGYPAEKFPTAGEVWTAFREAIWALLAPVIILGGILSGIFTPTEAGVIAAVYVILVSKFVYRELTLASLVDSLQKSVVTTARVTLLISMALVLGLVLTREQIPQTVASAFLSANSSPLVALLLLNILLIALHTALETGSTMIVVMPVVVPLLSALHVDLIHFGIILLVNSAIGINLPPIGFCLYISSSLSKVPLEKAALAMLPFTIALLVDLTIVTLFPQISLALPNLLLK